MKYTRKIAGLSLGLIGCAAFCGMTCANDEHVIASVLIIGACAAIFTACARRLVKLGFINENEKP